MKNIPDIKFTSVFLLFSVILFAQVPYPKNHFIAPMTIPLVISGSFGELRNNHFHTGLDFKTEQRTGLKVYAVADGYVSRIKVSSYGYGKSIYITHPNGYKTVYAHLSKYAPQVEAYVKERQYLKESFEIEMFPSPTELEIKQGDIIALSGNSGGSGGPHLHFEFRDSKTEKIINPLCFGFDEKISDTKKPSVIGVMVYPIGDSARVNKSSNPVKVNLMLQKDGSYLASKISARGKVGFGIQTYDTWDYSNNKNGIYRMQTYLNGSPYFDYHFETFSFNENSYINAFIDYSRYKRTNQKYQKLFMCKPYSLSIIDVKNRNGIIDMVAGMTNIYSIEVSDYNGNRTMITIPLQYDPEILSVSKDKDTKKTDYFLIAGKDNNYRKKNVSVFIPSDTFYEDFYLDFDVKDDLLTLGQDTIAAHKNMIITFDVGDKSNQEIEKMFIASVNGDELKYNRTSKKGNLLSAKVKKLGKFTLVRDTIAPVIKAINFIQGKRLTNQKTLELKISDNISGIKDYNAYLNGKWILMEYDYKTAKIIHYLDDAVVEKGKNDLRVIVTDNMGNSTIFDTYFFRLGKP